MPADTTASSQEVQSDMPQGGTQGVPDDLEASIHEFADQNGDYYTREFVKIQSAKSFPISFNPMAFLLGPIWSAARGIWGLFWIFLILELMALVQISRGLFGDLGADKMARYQRLKTKSDEMYQKAQAALQSGDEGAQSLINNSGNLRKAAERALEQAEAAAAGATTILIVGLGLFVAIRLVEAVYANLVYEKQYDHWRWDKTVPSGVNMFNLAFGAFLALAIVPLTIYRFTASKPEAWVTGFPANKNIFNSVAGWLENGFDDLAESGADVFNGITWGIRTILDGLEVLLVGTPWPVVMLVIVVTAWRIAGPRVAVFTVAALAYLAVLGYWDKSMATVALLGAAAFLCIVFGVPLGIWFGKSERAYSIARPVLDFMQTMPSFVYLIPVIAFFGTGKPPGILATIVFGMPPVIRLTALGLRHVPHDIKEAGQAFGCTRWQLLKNIEVPLAMPSIMTGINQTILMCLSMVVIAALIGAGGLGQDVLEALQYAAKGPGLLAGLAILFCAMVIDRIIQGAYKATDMSDK